MALDTQCQAAILCGGRGTRLKPTTDVIPKALAQLNGRPILDYILDFYQKKGFTRFFLCVGYKADKIKEHYSTPPPGTEIVFSDAGEDASMLERVWQLNPHVVEHLFVSYGDTFINLDLDRMFATHTEHQAEVTIVVAKIRNPFGLVNFDKEGWVTSFVEKPLLNYYIGSFILKKSAMEYMTAEMRQSPNGQGLVDFFLHLAEQKQLAVFEHKGIQAMFNTEFERRKAEKDLDQFYTYLEEA